jgi:pimeloyl-ACP methyl ester carboxylesterase
MRSLRRLLHRAALTCLLALPLSAAMGAPALDLDGFDRLKHTVALPNGMTLGVIEMGPASGRPVVLVHGYTDSARDWLPVVSSLDPAWHLIIVDIRGHGASGKPECCYDRIDFAYDIKLLLDHLHIERATIVGHSLGSIIAQTFAEFWPQRTERVVLVSSTGGTRASCPDDGVKTMDFRSEIMKLKDPIDPDSPWMIEWWSSPTPVPEEFIRRQRVDSAHMPVQVWLAVLEQGLTGSDLQATLPRLTAPTLLLWGEKDPIFGPRDRCSLREALPNAQVHVFEGLGHNPFWEQPAAFAAVMVPFVNGAH